MIRTPSAEISILAPLLLTGRPPTTTWHALFPPRTATEREGVASVGSAATKLDGQTKDPPRTQILLAVRGTAKYWSNGQILGSAVMDSMH